MNTFWGANTGATNTYAPTQYTPTQNNNYYSLVNYRPVTSIDEAKAAPINLDGSTHIFLDMANGNIYTKQLNQNRQPIFNVYVLEQPAPVNAPAATQEDVVKIMQNTISGLNEKISAIEAEIKTFKNSLGV